MRACTHVVSPPRRGLCSSAQVDRMVSDGARFAAEDARLQKKAEARRELEDAIFDLADNEEASDEMRDAAEVAEEWLQSNFDRLSMDDIQRRTAELRGMS